MATEEATLKAPTAAELEEFGPLRGYCVLCQEAVHDKDLCFNTTTRGHQKPLCSEREVPHEWQGEFYVICLMFSFKSKRVMKVK